MEKYQKFLTLVKGIYSLRSAQALLGWDQETMMPPRAGQGRAETQSVLSRIIQEKFCEKELGDLISELQLRKGMSEEQYANIREVKRDREKLLKIPVQLTEELAKTTSLAQQLWTEARPDSNTKLFNPWLKKVFDLNRHLADCLGYGESPYDALLDQYEPGFTSAEAAAILGELKEKIVPLLQKITHSNVKPDGGLLAKPFPINVQKVFNQMVLRAMTFQLEAGRLDESAHPFTEGIAPGDVRLTTRYSKTDVMSAVFGTIHEGGHGLYEQGFTPTHYGSPMAEAVSLGIHESQSRLWENQVGRSLPFWKYFFPKLQKIFEEQLESVVLEDFFLAVNEVKPSLIRVEADEVTYNLHIALRFEIEKAVLDGQLKVDEIEGTWNDKMKHTFGLLPPAARDGYMQDVHWSCGLIGYFPTYTLGNVYSAQLFARMKKDLAGLESMILTGDFYPLREWLRENVHQHGRKYNPSELIQKATGSPPDAGPFIHYLQEKYSALYRF